MNLLFHLKLLGLKLAPVAVRRRVMLGRFDREIREHGEAEIAMLDRWVKPGSLALDVGCNLGSYAYAMGRLSGNCIAFEPNPAIADMVRGLRLDGVTVRDLALSDTDGRARLTIPTAHMGHASASLLADVARGDGDAVDIVEVETRRLDGIGLGPVGFIKIDVEGAEEMVLAGADETIARDRPTMLIEIEERHNPGGLQRIAERLALHGYVGQFHTAGAWQPLERFDPGRHQDVSLIDPSVYARRREIPYVNNFLFQAAHAAAGQ